MIRRELSFVSTDGLGIGMAYLFPSLGWYRPRDWLDKGLRVLAIGDRRGGTPVLSSAEQSVSRSSSYHRR